MNIQTTSQPVDDTDFRVSTQKIPFRNWETWVRITEPKVQKAGALPLIVLHGGPGMAHNYVRNLSALAATGRTVIHYDQLGCGHSTHLPDAPKDFWQPQLFIDEFNNLVQHLGLTQYHVLGQSWGGMLGAEIAIQQPQGLRSLAICNSPASMKLWVEGAAELRTLLPEAIQDTLKRHEQAGTTSDPEYLRATDAFYLRYVCRMSPMPQDFKESVQQMEAEPTVYHTMNGPNEFHIIGSLKSWSVIDRLGAITVPTFVVAGEYDEATPSTWQPFVTGIKNAKSHVIADASHCAHLEKPEIFNALIADFLADNDD